MILWNVEPGSTLARTEVFGPVLGMMQVDTVQEAIQFVNSGKYGNMACVFTTSGVAFFPFSGWKNSFFGTLHAQGKHAVEFFTQTKVVVERWLGEWSRKF
jgi:malonate-semialdehyde dehydrogenase (acetylating) / methylmalonate-semialdehyde dehydrogenase